MSSAMVNGKIAEAICKMGWTENRGGAGWMTFSGVRDEYELMLEERDNSKYVLSLIELTSAKHPAVDSVELAGPLSVSAAKMFVEDVTARYIVD